ncbi:MAG: hypothetical protein AAF383_21005 [Cyanobacteria bacterium P01_A01_bin.83]
MKLSPNKPQQVTCPQLPLAVYREVAAHLRQVEGVNASVIMGSIDHEPTAKFDYYQSQVSALQIDCNSDLTDQGQQHVNQILDYYAQVYAPWQMK